MNRRLLALAFLLPLAACGTTVASYRLQITTENIDQRTELVKAVKRVIERRLGAMGEDPGTIELSTKRNVIRARVEVAAPIVKESLTEQLTESFELRIMSEAPDGKGDIVVEKQGSFAETGLTEKHLLWVTATKDSDPTKGRVILEFSEEGRKLMGDVFHKNKGKFIGLFVRKHLVSKLLVESDQVKDSIVITDIPTLLLANIFADDINVGLYVTFTPES